MHLSLEGKGSNDETIYDEHLKFVLFKLISGEKIRQRYNVLFNFCCTFSSRFLFMHSTDFLPSHVKDICI